MSETLRPSSPLPILPKAERFLSSQDPGLSRVIASRHDRWPTFPSEDPFWGLIRVVIAQQVATTVACRLARRINSAYPQLNTPSSEAVPDSAGLRELGLPQRRAECCAEIVRRSDEIRAKIAAGQDWGEALAGIKGIGPWTISVFRIMVLRQPDVLPTGDVGLERAVANVYGSGSKVEHLSEAWRPFRSVACWYLWRTLGNEQLG